MLRRRTLLRRAVGGALLPALPLQSALAQRTGTGTDYDVIVMGGGVAGLAATAALLRLDEELKVLVLEARQRLGGRVYSVERPELPYHVEMGAGVLAPPAGAAWPPIEELGLRAEPGEDGGLHLRPGMSSIVTSIAGASTGRVQLDCEVTEVLWRQGLIGVYYRNRGLESAVTARRLVCALPAALLGTAEGPLFSPRLPQDKQDALLALTFDSRISVALLLPADAVDVALLEGRTQWDYRGTGVHLSAAPAGERGEWLLEARYSGGRAARVAGRSEAQLCAGTLGEFMVLLGLASDVEVLWQAAVDWSGEQYSGAAVTRLADPGVHRTLAIPLNDTLFFAGDAVAEPMAVGTVHGAFASGERAAREVALSLGIPLVSPEPEEAAPADSA